MRRTNFLKKCVIASAMACVFFICGCTSVKQTTPLYVPIDYTADDAVATEMQRIEALPADQCVKALWRSKLLVLNTHDNKTAINEYNKFESIVVEAYKKAIAGRQYVEAYRYYRSLSACAYEGLSTLEKSSTELYALIHASVPGLEKNDENVQNNNTKVASYSKGTVTILVDKGIKVEKGMGYVDSVLGSGFFISKDGYIVTNNHVIVDCVNPKYEGYTRLYIKLSEDPDTRIPARVVGYDSILDLALIKAEVNAPYVFTLGSSSTLDVGDKIYAIGSPLGLENTLTSGIVSAVDRKLFTVGNVFQIDAAVNSGNSGGPLIDEQGRVQAIVFAGVQNYQGLNFAIPVEYLKSELPLLYDNDRARQKDSLAKTGKETKTAYKREHPWIASFGRTKKMPGSGTKKEGIEVQYVMPGGSASLGGLQVGDIVTSFDGESVSSLEDLQNDFIEMTTGTIGRLTVVDAEGSTYQRLVYLDKRPEQPGYEVYNHDVIALSFKPLLGMEFVTVSTD